MRKMAVFAAVLVLATTPAFAEPKPVHGISIHGEPKYPAGFPHLDYVNPNAPKGGEVVLGAPRTFDSLHPFILKGISAAGLGMIYETLTTGAGDDPDGAYGLIAETIEVADDRSWVVFNLRPEARFNDGQPITAEDVVWTFQTLTTKGHPQYKARYADVTKVEKLGERRVKFTFKDGTNRELPVIMGGLVVLPKHYWQDRDFERASLDPPLGSGQYRIANVDPGRSISYQRVKDYWGAKLPINVGRYNFDEIRYDYYRDMTVEFEAFKAGKIDFKREYTARDWATGYDVPPVRAGLIKKDQIRNENPARAQGLVFNTRRPIFQDRRVREALGFAFDFEWLNKTIAYGLYTRLDSYFPNSEFAAKGLPTGDELEILNRYRGKVPDEVFTKEFKPPVTDGSGNPRDNIRQGLELLKQAGWTVKGGKLVNAAGQPFEFELIYAQAGLERWIQPFFKNLERFGITAKPRLIDTAQFQNRTDAFDYDMIIGGNQQSLSPGTEQREMWGSKAAGDVGSLNESGVRDPVVDELVELVIASADRKQLVQRVRALDRVLLWGHYMIPQLYQANIPIAYWDKFARPPKPPKYTLGFMDTWWVDTAKAAALDQKRAALKN